MIGLMEADDTAVAAQLQAVSAALRLRLPELCQAVTDSIVRQIASLAAQVRSLLEGGPIEVNRVESALGYRLRQRHLGIVAWVEEQARKEGTLVELERMAGRLADQLSEGAHALFVARDESSAFMWMPLGSEQAGRSDALDGKSPVHDGAAHLAFGEPAEGPEGFGITIREALRAHAVAVMAGPAAARVIRFADVAPIALLAEDIDAARSWVLRALGPLAADDNHTARLRETLHVFLSTGGSYLETAERLSLHKNTVFYRVRKAEQIRGRPVGGDRFSVELALLAMSLAPASSAHAACLGRSRRQGGGLIPSDPGGHKVREQR